METIIVTSQEALNNAIQQALNSALSEQLPDVIRMATTKPYLTKKELMALTGWSSRQVEYKKSQRQIPFVRQGRLVLFPTKEVYAYLNEGYVPTRNEQGK